MTGKAWAIIQRGTRRTAVGLALLAALPAAATANPVADFYKGKTITLIAGFPPGGGYDANVRVLARHYRPFRSRATRRWWRRTCRARAR